MRYAIKNAAGAYYTFCDIVGAVDRIEADGTGKKEVHSRHVLKPNLDGHPKDCSKFDTEQDAKDAMANEFLLDANAFAGCVVVPIEG
jgi:hypothetical protein